jgi:hypothetical protein
VNRRPHASVALFEPVDFRLHLGAATHGRIALALVALHALREVRYIRSQSAEGIKDDPRGSLFARRTPLSRRASRHGAGSIIIVDVA